jgi:hypothetical protein
MALAVAQSVANLLVLARKKSTIRMPPNLKEVF